MDAQITYTIPISEAHDAPLKMVGGKTKNTGLCSQAGFRVPEGFSVTTEAYKEFIRNNGIDKIIEMELSRKKEQDMRWEEVWDSALRIRLAFTRGAMSPLMEESILESLSHWPETTLRVILALANDVQQRDDLESVQMGKNLSDAFLQKAREGSLQEEAENWLRIGRVSWKLRDDDNLLLAKLENQLQTFLREGLARLYDEKRIDRIPDKFDSKNWRTLYAGVREKTSIPLPLDSEEASVISQKQIKARQLIGQPSSPGIYSGVARVIQSIRDFKGTAKGEVLVFDAVEPQMTFIISLAGAIVERRGGMLVHSSIIAREMNIPAVNGVPKATSLIQTGDYITVNGDLGIVVIGKPEFSIELGT